MPNNYIFTSESVSAGHPDKLADLISDTILDRFLQSDPRAKVACETLVADQLVVVSGEFHCADDLYQSVRDEIPGLVQATLLQVGYTGTFSGIDPERCEIRLQLNRQSSNIRQGVDQDDDVIGAGDQGLVFGYATDETPELMPLPLVLAHRLLQRHGELLRAGTLPWLRPDAKSQVTVRYQDDAPVAVDTVVLSTQHDEQVSIDAIRDRVIREIIDPIIPPELRGEDFKVLINPTGLFVIGGPQGDTGLTGRKIIVDTYGGHCPHGGGAFSGKDPTKVDRSAAYMARYVAKNIVAAGIAKRCTIQIAYAIGVAEPVSVHLDFHGTGNFTEHKVESTVRDHFELTPAGIIRALDLQRPIYAQTTNYGHFGRDHEDFVWERTDQGRVLKQHLQRKGNLQDQRNLSRYLQELNSKGEISEEMQTWWWNRY